MDFEYQTSTELEVREAIVELYLNVKIRSTDEIANFNDDQMEDERERLYHLDSLEVLDYIKQSVEILMNMKAEEYDNYLKNKDHQEKMAKRQQDKLKQINDDSGINKNTNNKDGGRNANRFILNTSLYSSTINGESKGMIDIPADYEKVIQKLEGDIRNHIRVEQQLKLHIESVQTQLEELQRNNEKTNTQLETKIAQLKDKIKDKQKIIAKLEIDLQEKDKPLREKADLLQKMEEKIKTLERKHEEELENLKQEIMNYQQMEMQKLNEDKIRQLQIDLNHIQDTGLNNPLVNKQLINGVQNSFGYQSKLSSGNTSSQVDATQQSSRKFGNHDTFRSNQGHHNTNRTSNEKPFNGSSLGFYNNYGSNQTHRQEKTPTSNHNDLSNLDYLSTGNGPNTNGYFNQDTPLYSKNTDYHNANKETPTTASINRGKNIEKSKLIQSCLLRGSVTRDEHRRSQSNVSENYPPPPQTASQNPNKIIINQQHYFTDSIKIYQNDASINNRFQQPSQLQNPLTQPQSIQYNATQPQTSRQNSMESAKRNGKKRKQSSKPGHGKGGNTMFSITPNLMEDANGDNTFLSKLATGQVPLNSQPPISSHRYISAKRGAAQSSNSIGGFLMMQQNNQQSSVINQNPSIFQNSINNNNNINPHLSLSVNKHQQQKSARQSQTQVHSQASTPSKYKQSKSHLIKLAQQKMQQQFKNQQSINQNIGGGQGLVIQTPASQNNTITHNGFRRKNSSHTPMRCNMKQQMAQVSSMGHNNFTQGGNNKLFNMIQNNMFQQQ